MEAGRLLGAEPQDAIGKRPLGRRDRRAEVARLGWATDMQASEAAPDAYADSAAAIGKVIETPLAARHAAAGARMAVWFGCALPDSV